MARDTAALDLWLMDRMSAYDWRYSPDQPRDDHGRFGEGDGGGSSGGGVRASLAKAGTAEEVSAAAAAEARAITGHDIPFNMTGSDPQVAREHAEGVLRVLERYPQSSIQGVETVPLAGQSADGQATPYAMIRTIEGDDRVAFSSEWASQPGAYQASLTRAEEQGFLAAGQGTALATGIHEAAHQSGPGFNTEGPAMRIADQAAKAADMGTAEYVSSQLGSYAAVNGGELVATGVTDVILRGDSATDLSHELYAMNDREYQKFNVGN